MKLYLWASGSIYQAIFTASGAFFAVLVRRREGRVLFSLENAAGFMHKGCKWAQTLD